MTIPASSPSGEARADGLDGRAEDLGHLARRHADVVVEDDDRPLLDGEVAEATLELVAQDDGLDAVTFVADPSDDPIWITRRTIGGSG